ncbi:hypothetical protein SDC9_159842 [bioreactor metagenome]|uniref:Uncharacterized protein n=1 Tax=bioreactor metagenome TaxID=1076179 RepID=A0A645FJB3_9ZZZZ
MRRAFGPGQGLEHHAFRFLGAAHLEAAVGDHAQAVVLGVDLVLADRAVLQLADHGRRAQRDFVHAVLAVDHHHVFGAELLQHPHLDADQVGVENAHQRIRRTGRIGQRAKDIE